MRIRFLTNIPLYLCVGIQHEETTHLETVDLITDINAPDGKSEICTTNADLEAMKIEFINKVQPLSGEVMSLLMLLPSVEERASSTNRGAIHLPFLANQLS